MHRYTKAAGFPDFITERDLYEFVERNVAIDANLCKEVNIDSDTYIREYRLMLNSSIGFCAEFMTVGSHDPYLFTCFPFYDTYEKTSETPCLIERHTEKEVFSGIIDEAEPGISLIFYLTNSLSVRELTECQGAYLAAFANEGKVLLPVAHQEEESELEIYDRIQNEDLY